MLRQAGGFRKLPAVCCNCCRVLWHAVTKLAQRAVGLELVFQQNGQAVGDVGGLDDALVTILLFPPEQANSRQHLAAVIGDDLHRHAQTLAERAQVGRDGFAVAARQHSDREHLDIVMVGAIAFAA